MKIYIDESGSFANAPHADSWNIVGALVISEADDKKITPILNNLKIANQKKHTEEIKLRDVTAESAYFKFLKEMGRLKGRAICIATDAGLMQKDFVYNHQVKQAELIVEHMELLQHQSAKDGVQALASKLMTLSTQLYVQLLCHIELKLDVLHKAIPYYAQRIPMTLSHFKWFIDFKNAVKPDYEDLIHALTRVLLQTRSMHDPIPWVSEWNDRGLQNNIFQDGEPTYLREVYKLPTSRDSKPLNLGKIFEKMEFIDSKKSVGIQIIDLISSGVRRCLRKEFHDNHTAAILLGNLMIQGKHNKSPIHFISFSDESKGVLDDLTSEYVKLMVKHCKPMISNTSI